MPSLTELRQQRGQHVAAMKTILDKAEGEKRELTAEESQEWTRFDGEQEKLGEQVKRAERQQQLDREMAESRGPRAGQQSADDPAADEKREQEAYAAAFRRYLQVGVGDMEPEERAILRRGFRRHDAREVRAQSVGTDTAGGYVVPTGFSGMLEESLKEFGGMREAATEFRTDSGQDLEWPTADDTGQTGALLAENTQDGEQDVTFGIITFKAYKYTSKIIRVSVELLQDSAFNIEQFLARAFATRIGRITNTHFTTGDNSAKPQGVVTGASSGVTAAGTTTVSYEELLDLLHAIDPAYRRSRGARWMFNDGTLKALKKLKDGQGRPLWLPGIVTREPDTLLGYPYTINQDVAALAASSKSILFGDFSKYMIRDVRGITVVRMVERYADFHQVGFVAFARHDGRVLDAGTDPVKFVTQAAS